MKVRIQSKSGDYNSEVHASKAETLKDALTSLRLRGSHPATYRNSEVEIPFEEIEYIVQVVEETIEQVSE